MCLLISLREYFMRLQPSIIQYSKLVVKKCKRRCVHFRKKHSLGLKFDGKFVTKH